METKTVVRHDHRDGLIRNKIRSRKLMMNFESKSFKLQGGAKVLLQNFMSILVLINLTKKLN